MRQFVIANEADQRFDTIINGQRVGIRFRYNPTTDRWTFDLAVSTKPVLHGRKIVIGVDLLAAFDLGLGAIIAIASDGMSEPNRNNLINGKVGLYHVTQEELDAAAISS